MAIQDRFIKLQDWFNKNHIRRSVFLMLSVGALGGLIGFILGGGGASLTENLWKSTLTGFLLGALFVPFLGWVRFLGSQLGVKELKLPLPGGAYSISLQPEQRRPVWNIFIEFATRIATVSLKQGPEGDLGALKPALNSLYETFKLVRTELKSMPPSPPPLGNEITLEAYVLDILNNEIRPFLAFWHPRLDEWLATGMPENQWPLATICRDHLEYTQVGIVKKVRTLGKMLSIPNLDMLVPSLSEVGHVNPGDFLKDKLAEIARLDKKPGTALAPEIAAGAWLLLLDLAAFHPVLLNNNAQIPEITARAAEVRQLLVKLQGTLKSMPLNRRSNGDLVKAEMLVLELIKNKLGPFASRWDKADATKETTDKPWEDFNSLRGSINSCIQELENLLGCQQSQAAKTE